MSACAPFCVYVYTAHLCRVCGSYFPRKSLSKPQTDTPWIHHSNSDKLKMWTCYITLVSLGTSQGFLHAVPKVLLSVRIQLLTNAKCQSDRAGTDLWRDDCRSRQIGWAVWPTPLQLLCCPLTSTTHILFSTADTPVLSKRAASAWWHCRSKPVHLSW